MNFILTVDITKTPHLPASKVIHALDTLLSKERVLSPLDLSAIPYADSIGPDLFLPKQQVSAAAQALQDTIFEFKHAFDGIPEMLVRGREAAREQNQPADVYGDPARLEAAGHFLMQAQGTPIDRALEPAVRAYTTDLLLRAEVEIDSFFHPSSDPTIGWIKREAAKDDTLRVVTQLSRFSLSHDGEITQFGFKPHKCDLLGVAVGLSASKSGSAALGRIEKNAFLVESPFSNSEPHKVTRETLDLIGLRYVLKSEGVDAALSKEFLFHSEIGAHLPNATTGFSLEYWVDSPKPLSQLLLLSFFVSLPSCDAHSAVGKPLLCVGGVSEGRLSLDAHNFIPTNAVPGGLFGMRIIDTLDDLFIDIRSSKQLNAASVEPVWQMPEKRHGYAGAKVMLGIDASRIRGDEKSATIFISVM